MVKMLARAVGVLFVVLGVAGLFADSLFGLLYFDGVRNSAHLIVGLAGILASGREENAVWFAKMAGIGFVLLGIVGLARPEWLWQANLTEAESVLHLIVGAVASYAGFTAQAIQTVRLGSRQ